MSRRVYERSPLSCSHPIDRCKGKLPEPRPFVSQFTGEDADYAAATERDTLARRAVS